MPRRLVTDRLTLRAPSRDDVPAIWAYASDPVATRYMVWPTHVDRDDLDDHLDDIAEGWAGGDDFAYAIVLGELDDVVGMVSAQFSDEGVEIGFIVARPYQRRGIATEAAGAVMQAVQSLDDVYRIWASCDADNPASAGVLRALGMQFEGCLRRRSARPNRTDVRGPQDDHIYAWVR
ncbi:MAG: hypothetical protein CMP08_04380 [Xanthomonadales bacterium]|nr:hypothetical protein [Xanthomonadales bacterium]